MQNSTARALALALATVLIPACGSSSGKGGGGDGSGDNAPPGSTGWTMSPGNPVLPRSTSFGWDSFGTFYPSVVHPAPLSYLMWYEGYRELFVGGGPDPIPAGPPSRTTAIVGAIVIRAIGLASSSDGLVWTRSGTAPVLSGSSGSWDNGGVGTPCLLPNGPTDRMWYTGWGSAATAIGLATFDSVSMTWKNSASAVLSADAGPAWDSVGVMSPCVVFDGATYRMWYVAAADESAAGLGIGVATSADGVTWTKSPQNPVLLPGSSGAPDHDGVGSAWVVRDGTSYRMWYAGWSAGRPTLCYASSSDGVQWTKYSGNPVLSGGTSGTWDSQGLFTPSVLLEGRTFRMWMAGRDDSSLPQIGYATNP
jgi:predicted GH43/DUF377 family glycosyl hydrolase